MASAKKIGRMKITVKDASGKSKDEVEVWDQKNLEGFVKIEVRGGPEPQKATTRVAKAVNSSITWNQELLLDVWEGADELRVMLCKEKKGDSGTTAVVAAAGIYVKDIIRAVPLDKYFDLFKPGGVGGEGGFICLAVEFQPATVDVAPIAAPRSAPAASSSAAKPVAASSGEGGGLIKKLAVVAALGGVIFAAIPKKKKSKSRRR